MLRTIDAAAGGLKTIDAVDTGGGVGTQGPKGDKGDKGDPQFDASAMNTTTDVGKLAKWSYNAGTSTWSLGTVSFDIANMVKPGTVPASAKAYTLLHGVDDSLIWSPLSSYLPLPVAFKSHVSNYDASIDGQLAKFKVDTGDVVTLAKDTRKIVVANEAGKNLDAVLDDYVAKPTGSTGFTSISTTGVLSVPTTQPVTDLTDYVKKGSTWTQGKLVKLGSTGENAGKLITDNTVYLTSSTIPTTYVQKSSATGAKWVSGQLVKLDGTKLVTEDLASGKAHVISGEALGSGGVKAVNGELKQDSNTYFPAETSGNDSGKFSAAKLGAGTVPIGRLVTTATNPSTANAFVKINSTNNGLTTDTKTYVEPPSSNNDITGTKYVIEKQADGTYDAKKFTETFTSTTLNNYPERDTSAATPVDGDLVAWDVNNSTYKLKPTSKFYVETAASNTLTGTKKLVRTDGSGKLEKTDQVAFTGASGTIADESKYILQYDTASSGFYKAVAYTPSFSASALNNYVQKESGANGDLVEFSSISGNVVKLKTTTKSIPELTATLANPGDDDYIIVAKSGKLKKGTKKIAELVSTSTFNQSFNTTNWNGGYFALANASSKLEIPKTLKQESNNMIYRPQWNSSDTDNGILIGGVIHEDPTGAEQGLRHRFAPAYSIVQNATGNTKVNGKNEVAINVDETPHITCTWGAVNVVGALNVKPDTSSSATNVLAAITAANTAITTNNTATTTAITAANTAINAITPTHAEYKSPAWSPESGDTYRDIWFQVTGSTTYSSLDIRRKLKLFDDSTGVVAPTYNLEMTATAGGFILNPVNRFKYKYDLSTSNSVEVAVWVPFGQPNASLTDIMALIQVDLGLGLPNLTFDTVVNSTSARASPATNPTTDGYLYTENLTLTATIVGILWDTGWSTLADVTTNLTSSTTAFENSPWLPSVAGTVTGGRNGLTNADQWKQDTTAGVTTVSASSVGDLSGSYGDARIHRIKLQLSGNIYSKYAILGSSMGVNGSDTPSHTDPASFFVLTSTSAIKFRSAANIHYVVDPAYGITLGQRTFATVAVGGTPSFTGPDHTQVALAAQPASFAPSNVLTYAIRIAAGLGSNVRLRGLKNRDKYRLDGVDESGLTFLNPPRGTDPADQGYWYNGAWNSVDPPSLQYVFSDVTLVTKTEAFLLDEVGRLDPNQTLTDSTTSAI